MNVKALTVIDLALHRRCLLHRGQSVAEGTPLSATDRIEEENPHVKPNLFLIIEFICASLIMDLTRKPIFRVLKLLWSGAFLCIVHKQSKHYRFDQPRR